MTLRELVFMCMDEIKLNSDDSFYTEDHVAFLLSKYRSFILKKEMEKPNKLISSANKQDICLDLEEISTGPCVASILKTVNKLPSIVYEAGVSIYPVNYYSSDNMIYTTMERLRYIGYNKWAKNLMYAAKGPDDYLYVNSQNPQFRYLEKVHLNAVFEDFIEVAKYSCDEDGTASSCDYLDMKFPIEDAFVPVIIELVVKELLGTKYQPKDTVNNATEDLPKQSSSNSK